MGDRFKDVAAGLILLVLFVVLGLFAPSLPFAVSFVGLFAVLFNTYVLGKRLFPSTNPILTTTVALIPFFAFQSIAQTIWFYLGWTLGSTSDVWCTAGAIVITLLIQACSTDRDQKDVVTQANPTRPRTIALGALCFAISCASAIFVLTIAIRRATSDALLTPWTVLPPGTIPAIVIAWLSVYLGIRLTGSRGLALVQSLFALATTTAIVPLLYTLGYGFDGFLHIATERLILATGTLTPKPFYYIGQYVFTTWVARTANLPIELVDRWLVPAATALLLPLAVFLSTPKGKKPWAAFFLFLIPLAAFITTTPQSFAYLLGLTALLLCRGVASRDIHPLAPITLACWSLAVHPLAGLPIILIVLALLCLTPTESLLRARLGGTVSIILVVASATAIPLAFYVLSLHGSTPITWNLGSIFTTAPWQMLFTTLSPWLGNRFVVWPAWATLVSMALPVLLIAAAVADLASHEAESRKTTGVLLAAAMLLFVAGALLKSAGDFAFLIDYERGNYADRLNVLALFCLIPAALPSLERLLKKTETASPLLAAGVLGSILAIAAANSYNALPRNDALVTGHGWTVGQSDLAAVKSIDRDAGNKPYTVLANQSVSAAAVAQLGFKRYNGETFFYPIPTGGALYDEYLKMTYQEPSRDTAADAAKLGGTTLLYVVVNDYWWNAENLAESIGNIANGNWTIGDTTQGLGHVDYVFKFDVSTPSNAPSAASGS